MTGPSRRYAVAFVIGLAILLRLAALDKPLYVDEIATLTIATQPLAGMTQVMRQIDASPHLFPLTLHAWLAVHRSDAWARLLSSVFGVLAVAAIYVAARRMFGTRTAIAAAFVAAIAPAHVHYAQYVRGYSLFTLLAVLHWDAVHRWFAGVSPGPEGPGYQTRRERSGDQTRPEAPGDQSDDKRQHAGDRRRFAWLVVLTTALLYTHYLALLLLVPEGLYALWKMRRLPRRAVAWGGAVALGGVLFLPGAPLLLHNLAYDRLRNEDRPAPPSPVTLLPNLLGELSMGERRLGFADPALRRATLAAGAVVFSLLLLSGILSGWRRHRDATLLLVMVAFVPVLVYVGTGRKLVAVRFFLPFMTAYLVLLGHGLASLRFWAGWIAGAALAAVCAIPLVHFYRDFQWSYDRRAVAKEMTSRGMPGDVWLFVHPYEALAYRWYLGPDIRMQGLVFTALGDQGGYIMKPPPLTLDRATSRITQAAQNHARFWIVGQSRRSFASDAVEERRLFEWMETRYERVADLSNLTGGDPIVRQYRAARTP